MAPKTKKAKRKTAKKKTAPGRPTRYGPEARRLLTYLAPFGFTNDQLAQACGITRQTLDNWSKRYPKFFDTIKTLKAKADAEVQDALFKRATGYSHTETKAQWVNDDGGGRWETLGIVKHYPPDPTSMIFWLKNRQPELWSDRKDLNLTGGIGVHIPEEDRSMIKVAAERLADLYLENKAKQEK